MSGARHPRGTAMVVAAAALLATGACSLLTDLSGLSGGPNDDAGSISPISEAGTTDASTDEAGTNEAGAKEAGADAGADADAGRSAYAAAVLADAPVAYLRLGEGPGAVIAQDATGHGHNGALGAGHLFGVPGAVIGDVDTALRLDGTSSGIVLGSSGFDFSGTQSYSVEVWTKIVTYDTTFRHFFQRAANASDGRASYGLYVRDGALAFERFAADIAVATSTDATSLIGKWRHIVGTYDGASVRLWVDAALTGTQADVRPMASTGAPLTVGCDKALNAGVIQGDLDEVAIYDKALAADRILAHFRTGHGP